MIKILLLLSICISFVFSFDSIEVLNPNIIIHKSGYFKTDKNLTPQEVSDYVNSNQLSKLPKKASSFGFDTNTYWFMFEISSNLDHNFIEYRNNVSQYSELFVFKDSKLIKTIRNGFEIPIKNREIQTLEQRFELQQGEYTYLLKVNSLNPHYFGFAFGSQNELDKTWNFINYIFIFTFGIFIALILYNLFLYFTIKDKTYIYYVFYLTGLELSNITYSGYWNAIFPSFVFSTALLVILFTCCISLIGLVLFTIEFLNLKELNNKLRIALLWAIVGTIFVSFTLIIGHDQFILLIFIFTSMFMVLYAGYISYKNGYKPALFFISATGVGLILIILFGLMHQGLIIEYGLFGINFLNIALIWDLIVLSFALAYRIKLLQEEKDLNQKLALVKSKQSSLGEISGNIAHQWRQPLAELGSINTSIEAQLKYGEISKEEILTQIKLNKNILNHLSQTINTFQSFFQNSNIETKFCVNDEIIRCIDFISDSMKSNHIDINFSSDDNYFLKGNENEFSQIILNIVLNAKDALCEKDIENKYINIELKKYEDKFKIEISDNAGGIKIEPIESIFESYVTSKDKGIGIGLFIVKTLVEQKFKGKISASNTKDGARFEMFF